MNSNELRLLADHMGHDLNIHANHYSLQSNLLEQAKVARVLTAVENGKFSKRNTITNLADVPVQDSDVIEDDVESEDGKRNCLVVCCHLTTKCNLL